jgi:nicotinate phosphoribosyltransferase
MPSYVEDEFFDYLREMDLKELKVYAIKEGSLVFPRIPLMRLEGPLPIVQLLETTLLVLVNYARLESPIFILSSVRFKKLDIYV